MGRKEHGPTLFDWELPKGEMLVVGVGGAGTELVARLNADGECPAELWVVDTDGAALLASAVERRILARPKAQAPDPEALRTGFRAEAEKLREAFRGRRAVLVLAGLGGLTGSALAPVLCRLAREEGALAVALASGPFAFEGQGRGRTALVGAEELACQAELLIGLDAGRVRQRLGERLTLGAVREVVNETMSRAVVGLCSAIALPGPVGDREGGLRHLALGESCALFGAAQADIADEADLTLAVGDALHHALLQSFLFARDLARGGKLLALLACARDLTVAELDLAQGTLARLAGEKTDFRLITAINKALGDTVLATVVLSPQPAGLARILPFDPRAYLRGLENAKALAASGHRSGAGLFGPGERTGGLNLDVPTFLRRRGAPFPANHRAQAG